tara:strand:+ start:1817 stop:2113 length:297 start_codon:yes stop_codon:yes gene_type:complete
MAIAESKKIKSVNRWSPNPAPVSAEQLPDYLFNELNRLGDILFNIDMLQLSQTNVEPGTELRRTKPRDGDVRYADGTNWNPSGGEGIYAYYNATWNKL